MKNVLIAGGSGFVGTKLAEFLKKKDYNVRILSRKKAVDKNYFYWNHQKEVFDSEAFNNIDVLINLAGANISSRRWTNAYKQEIYNSRINSTKFLFKILSEKQNRPKLFISASATGFYGTYTSDKIFNENDEAGNDFLANVCKDWEKEAINFKSLNIKTLILRFGVIFDKHNGAFKKIANPVKNRIGTVIGTGNQYIPWIQINDLVKIIDFSISKNLEGIYNCVAPENVTNSDLTHQISDFVHKRIFRIKTPEKILQLILGEMSSIILYGSRISSEKIINEGFKFDFPNIKTVLPELLTS